MNTSIVQPPPRVSLRTEALSVQFGGHHAVAGVTLDFHSGTLTAIVGPNGAGKTTLFNLISGQIRRSSGTVLLAGEDVSDATPAQRTRRGIGRAFQLTNLFPNLTVHENVRLAVQASMPGSHASGWCFLLSRSTMHRDLSAKADAILREIGLDAKAGLTAAMLSHGDQRKLEVAILMALDAEVLMFDEPTAGMTNAEAPAILDLIRALKRERRKTLVLVEHKLNVVRELADRVIVMVEGKVLADGDPDTVIALPVVQEAYLGRQAAAAATH